MQAGQLRHRIRIERPVVTLTSAGEPIASWAEVDTVWAAVAPTTGREYFLRDQVRDEVDTAILMRWSPNVAAMDPTWRVVFQSVEYDVQAVLEADMRNRQMRVFAKRKAQAAGQGSIAPTPSPAPAPSPTPSPPPPPPAESIWASPTPANPNVGDNVTGSLVLGVKFQSSVAGSITGIRAYISPGDMGGVWAARLHTAGGTLLAENAAVTVTTGAWNTIQLLDPVPIAANTTYVASVSVRDQTGAVWYPADAGGLASPVVNGHLSTVAGGNGVFVYPSGPSSSGYPFPSHSFGDANYWRDVVFVADN